jgi:hypothetical protein
MLDLQPHPLVVSIGTEFGAKGHASLKKVSAAVAAFPATATENDLATELANQADRPDLTLVAGLLGGPITYDNRDWRLLYLDSRLYTWLLVPEADIIACERLGDDSAPLGKRDMLWINHSAPVVHGSGFGPNEQRFLVGEFTRAADFAPETRGGTFSAASGLICDATTPSCVCFSPRTR